MLCRNKIIKKNANRFLIVNINISRIVIYHYIYIYITIRGANPQSKAI